MPDWIKWAFDGWAAALIMGLIVGLCISYLTRKLDSPINKAKDYAKSIYDTNFALAYKHRHFYSREPHKFPLAMIDGIERDLVKDQLRKGGFYAREIGKDKIVFCATKELTAKLEKRFRRYCYWADKWDLIKSMLPEIISMAILIITILILLKN